MGSIRDNNGHGQSATSPTAGRGTATTEEDGVVRPLVEEFSPPTTEQLNLRCTGVKRLLKEAAELRHANEMFCARPMEDNLFEWHFSVRGPPDSSYAGGIYHGRIVLPADYPMKPPNLILLTPNGRFETNKKICLSISGYHPETWLPSWSIRTALLALIGFMPTHSAGALGGLECSHEERRRLAIKSLDWRCEMCGVLMRSALPPAGSTGNGQTERLLKEIRGASGNKTKTAAGGHHDQIKSLPPPMISSSSSTGGSCVSSNGSSSFPAPPPALLSVAATAAAAALKSTKTNQSQHRQQQQHMVLNSSNTSSSSASSAALAAQHQSTAATAASSDCRRSSLSLSSVPRSSSFATAAAASAITSSPTSSSSASARQRRTITSTTTTPHQQQNARRSSVVSRSSTLMPLVCIGLLALLLFALVFRRISSPANGVSSTQHSSPFSSSSAGGGDHLSL